MSVEQALAAAKAASQAEQGLDALEELAAALVEHPEAPELYLAASRCLIAACEAPDTVRDWAGRAGLCAQLLRQVSCPATPPILAHEVASNLTSGNRDVVVTLVDLVGDVVQALLDDDAGETLAGFKNVVVFALTTRAVAGDWLDQTRLSALHLTQFERFTVQDMALPYSVMFSPDLFGQNRDELLAFYWPQALADGARLHQLPPTHVLLLSWLAGRDAFTHPTALVDYLDQYLPGSESDQAAARSLLLRHWIGAAPAQLDAWGLAELALLLNSQAACALPEAHPPRGRGVKWLQNRPYQAFHAAKNRVAPFLAQRGKPKVAICLSGQLRGYEAALDSWKKTFLPLIEPVFFVHSWGGIGRSDAQPYRYVLPFEGVRFSSAYKKIGTLVGHDEMRARYPSLFAALSEGNQVDVAMLQERYGTPHVVLEDDADQRFASFSNQQKMHYKIHAADALAQAQGEFDLHLRLRPDLAVGMVGFDWRDLKAACDAAPVLFAEKEAGLHYATLMIGDQCAIGRPEVMARYAGTWEQFPTLAAAGLAGCPAEFTGHTSLAFTTWAQKIDVKRLPLRFGALQDAAPLPASVILRMLQADSRGNAEDRTLIDAIQSDLEAQ